MRFSLERRASVSNASSPRAKRGSCDSVGSKRSRSASMDKQARQEPRGGPMLIMPRPVPMNVGPSSSRSDHRRHVLDAVRAAQMHVQRPCHLLPIGMQGLSHPRFCSSGVTRVLNVT